MPYLVSLVVLAGMIFALVDIITRDQSLVKHMPKTVWLFVVILLPFLGTVLWFAIGREYPENGIRLGRPQMQRPTRTAPAPPPVTPVDTRTTEQQIADLDREIEEWRLREELEKRRREQGESSSDPGTRAE